MSRPLKGDLYLDNEIRVKGIPPQTHTDLIHISQNLGISLSALLKPELRKIADSYSPELKNPPEKD